MREEMTCEWSTKLDSIYKCTKNSVNLIICNAMQHSLVSNADTG